MNIFNERKKVIGTGSVLGIGRYFKVVVSVLDMKKWSRAIQITIM